MIIYKNILIVVDGLYEVEWVFNRVVGVVKCNDVKLIIVNVIDLRIYFFYEVYDV